MYTFSLCSKAFIIIQKGCVAYHLLKVNGLVHLILVCRNGVSRFKSHVFRLKITINKNKHI